MNEIQHYATYTIGGGLVAKITWDWLKYGRGNQFEIRMARDQLLCLQ